MPFGKKKESAKETEKNKNRKYIIKTMKDLEAHEKIIIKFTKSGWDDYLYWDKKNKNIVLAINKLIEEVSNETIGIMGQPWRLSAFIKRLLQLIHNRRPIDDKNNFEYRITWRRNLVIKKCRNPDLMNSWHYILFFMFLVILLFIMFFRSQA